ncbi:protein farnesyltransferase subunit beta isoform X1 [Oryza sativa Japonica Group]|nr:protein farnesyltransferase subunit beta [Oryza sativa Japonica Group]
MGLLVVGLTAFPVFRGPQEHRGHGCCLSGSHMVRRLSVRSPRLQRARRPPPSAPPTTAPMDPPSPPPPPPYPPAAAEGGPAADSQAAELPRLTVTQVEQMKVEAKVGEIYRVLFGNAPNANSLMLELWREQHVEYLTRGLKHLGPSFHVLDANRPWLCYWIIHALALLDEIPDDVEDDIVDFLSRCQDKDGGYGGGPGQLPHLATTYAAVNTLVTIGSERALSSVNRDNLYKFMLRMKDTSGAFRMHDGGEIDVRASYTAISVASLVNILDGELAKGVGNYITRCQTYEGGIAGEPYAEAHGGYTFCGLATMILLNEVDKLDLASLIGWVAFRQGVECGFQGRTNKLVDGCYSFWQGAALALTQKLMTVVDEQLKSSYSSKRPPGDDACGTSSSTEAAYYAKFGFDFIEKSNQIGPLFHNIALQQYILLCAQVLDGGLRDKPGKNRDHYHSCYCLSGLSVSQYSAMVDSDACPLPQHVLGPYSNLLEPIHPLYNVVLDKYHTAYEFFSS